MKALIGTVLQTLFKTLIDSAIAWWKAEEAEAAKWAAESRKKMIESMKEGRSVENAWNNTPTPTVTTPRGWNTLPLLLFVVLLAGCHRFYVYVEPYQPVPTIPERPVLAEEPEFSERELQLVEYSLTLEALLKEIRDWAIEKNRNNEYAE